MKNSTALRGKNDLSSPYNWAARVLLCDSTSVGRPNRAMTCAIVIVLAEPVLTAHRQADDERLALGLLPIDVDAALRLGRKHQQVGAVGAVDRDTAPLRDVADHRVPRDRLAALGLSHHHPVHPLDLDAPEIGRASCRERV